MKSCEYIKGVIGLIEYSDKDVFEGYPIMCIDDQNYVTDKVEVDVYNHQDAIKYRVVTKCVPLRV